MVENEEICYSLKSRQIEARDYSSLECDLRWDAPCALSSTQGHPSSKTVVSFKGSEMA